ncbi:MAG: D-2-hydroxyacid dehydrogenase [Clostridiales bacterium]|nr:D-2-hydroxyacid dehydrogenase [Clostridiales bacterium]
MPEIREALVTVYAPKEELDRLFAALQPAKVHYVMPYLPDAKAKIAEYAKTCDVAILNGDLYDFMLENPNLKWVHCCHAGVDRSARPEVFEKGILLTSSAGRSAPALAEHALLFMQMLTYDMPMLFRAQGEHRWAVSRDYMRKTNLFGKTLGIIGLGNTGAELARMAKAFRMEVLGWRRSRKPADNVDRVYASEGGDDLNAFLSQCDYVVLCAELNDDTFHMIDAGQLAAMKPSAFLINVGRGKLVNEPALIQALQDGTIAGAGLDTFETEPLPESSPLWELPNVIITPHATPALTDREARSIGYAIQNIKAYREGGTMVNRVTEKSIFSGQRSPDKY